MVTLSESITRAPGEYVKGIAWSASFGPGTSHPRLQGEGARPSFVWTGPLGPPTPPRPTKRDDFRCIQSVRPSAGQSFRPSAGRRPDDPACRGVEDPPDRNIPYTPVWILMWSGPVPPRISPEPPHAIAPRGFGPSACKLHSRGSGSGDPNPGSIQRAYPTVLGFPPLPFGAVRGKGGFPLHGPERSQGSGPYIAIIGHVVWGSYHSKGPETSLRFLAL